MEALRSFAYEAPPEIASGETAHCAVLIVGAGPVGLACALDLGLHGVRTLVLDDGDTVSTGSRAICYAKRTLEILDRYGCGEAVASRGVGWRTGKVFHRDRLAYAFDLQPEPGHRRPAFVNLQQYHLESAMIDRLAELGTSVIRWRHRVAALEQDAEAVVVRVDTPDGSYRVRADWLVACDGARSTVRGLLGLDFRGQVFRDRFLIADVRMAGDFPTERWFWFDPPFHPGQSVLLHRQADDVWRIDFQLGWDADPELERQPGRVLPRIRAMLGDDRPFELEWVSVYTFQCRRIERFVHGRVVFAGDAAHQVSPFGARGANSGIQDADNLGWKLARVLSGRSPPALLRTYDRERVEAADENILNSTRATDFITPKSRWSHTLREAVLTLAQRHEFARRMVNSGRLSLPTCYRGSLLSTEDTQGFDEAMGPGSPSADAPVAVGGRATWWLALVGGSFEVVLFAGPDGPSTSELQTLAGALDEDSRGWVVLPVGTRAPALPEGLAGVVDSEGLLSRRFDARPGTVCLLRPDQHVAARWRQGEAAALQRALRRARGLDIPEGA